jgi:hypothetical protein
MNGKLIIVNKLHNTSPNIVLKLKKGIFLAIYDHSFQAATRNETSLYAVLVLRRDDKRAICIVVAQIHYTARGGRWRTILVSPPIYQLPDAYSCINVLDMRGFTVAVACNLICAKT